MSLARLFLYEMAATDDKYKVYVISVSGGAVTIANVEVVVVSGPANTAATTTPVAAAGVVATVGSTAHTDLMAGDKTTITLLELVASPLCSGTSPVERASVRQPSMSWDLLLKHFNQISSFSIIYFRTPPSQPTSRGELVQIIMYVVRDINDRGLGWVGAAEEMITAICRHDEHAGVRSLALRRSVLETGLIALGRVCSP